MKRFEHVFPEDFLTPSYPTMRLELLEEAFREYSREPERNFFHLALIADGLRLRFSRTKELRSGMAYKQYLVDLEGLRKLRREVPSGGNALIAEWKTQVANLERKVGFVEERLDSDENRLRIELGFEGTSAVPKSFEEYLKLKRLQYFSGSDVPGAKARELQKIGMAATEWPYLYWSLSKRIRMFQESRKVAMVHQILQVDAIDLSRSSDRLSEDDGYIDNLVALLETNDESGLRVHVTANRAERETKRKAALERGKQKLRPGAGVRELVLRMDNGLLLDGVELLNPKDWLLVKGNKTTIEKLQPLFQMNVRNRNGLYFVLESDRGVFEDGVREAVRESVSQEKNMNEEE